MGAIDQLRKDSLPTDEELGSQAEAIKQVFRRAARIAHIQAGIPVKHVDDGRGKDVAVCGVKIAKGDWRFTGWDHVENESRRKKSATRHVLEACEACKRKAGR
jgi:hypothetical protein